MHSCDPKDKYDFKHFDHTTAVGKNIYFLNVSFAAVGYMHHTEVPRHMQAKGILGACYLK